MQVRIERTAVSALGLHLHTALGVMTFPKRVTFHAAASNMLVSPSCHASVSRLITSASDAPFFPKRCRIPERFRNEFAVSLAHQFMPHGGSFARTLRAVTISDLQRSFLAQARRLGRCYLERPSLQSSPLGMGGFRAFQNCHRAVSSRHFPPHRASVLPLRRR